MIDEVKDAIRKAGGSERFGLSDVLLARKPEVSGTVNTQRLVEIVSAWNLRTDDLTKQSNETISFIHSLLTV